MIAAEQARAFLVMTLCGIVCALVHDALRLAGWILGGRAGCTAMMDLFLGAVLAAGMTAAGLYLGMSPMRLYLFGGVGLGAALYYATLGRIAREACAFIRRERSTG